MSEKPEQVVDLCKAAEEFATKVEDILAKSREKRRTVELPKKKKTGFPEVERCFSGSLR